MAIGAIFYYRPDSRGTDVISIESNLEGYRVIPLDKGGLKPEDYPCIELDLDVCKGTLD